MASSSGGTTPNTPDDDQARLAQLEAMQRAATWSGSDPNATNSSETGATTFDMNALRAQAGALGRAADAANAARNGDVGVSSVTQQSTGSQYLPGSEPTPYTPAPVPSQSIPQDTSALARAAATGGSLGGTLNGAGAGTGQSTLAGPGGTGTPQTQTGPTTISGGGINAGAFAGAIASGDKGPGAGPTTTVPGASGADVGTGGPSGAGAGAIDQTGAGGLGALTSQITSQLQSIGQSVIGANASPDVQGIFMQQTQSILAMLDQQEAQLRADNQKNGTTIDPATQFTIDKLRQTLDDNLKTVKEDLNRRGLSDSGIQLELENRLQKGSMSDQAQILGQRLSKLQDQLQAGLSNIQSQKYSTVNQFGLAGANAQYNSGENAKKDALQREQDQLTGMLNLRNQQSGENQGALSRAATAANLASTQKFEGNESALQRAYGEAQNKAQTAAQFDLNKQKYEQDLSLQNARGAGTANPTPAQTAAATTAAAVKAIQTEYSNSPDAVSALYQRQAQIVASIGQAGFNKLLAAAQGLPDWNYGGNH